MKTRGPMCWLFLLFSLSFPLWSLPEDGAGTAAAPECDDCEPNWESWPVQRAAVCSGKAVLQADPSFETFRWFRGEVASGVEDDPYGGGGVPVHRPIELTEWRNCPSAELGPGSWYVMMEKTYPSDDGSPTVRRVLRPFVVERNKTPSFKLVGVPDDQVPYGSALDVTLDVDGVDGYKGYRLKTKKIENNQSAAAAKPAADRPWTPHFAVGGKGSACLAFEASRRATPEQALRAARKRAERADKTACEVRDKLAENEQRRAELTEAIRSKPKISPVRREEMKDLLDRLQVESIELKGALRHAELEQATADLRLDHAERELAALLEAERALLSWEQTARIAASTVQREDAEAEVARLKKEIARLRRALAATGPPPAGGGRIQGTRLRDVPRHDTEYTVTVFDAKGCEATQTFKVGVRRYRVDFFFGTEYSTYRGGLLADSDMMMDGDADDPMMAEPPPDPMMEESMDDGAFGDPVVFGGALFEHAFSRKFSGFGEIRFGAINVETRSAPASSADVENVIRDAEAASFHFGFRWAFLEEFCEDEKGAPRREKEEAKWFRRLICRAQAGEQVQFDFVGRWGFSILTEDEDRIRDDFLDDWTVGIAFRNDNSGGRLDGSFFQIGYGRSDNFRRNMDRFKLDGAMVLELPGTKWDLHLAGAFDADRSLDADDLRITIGLRRDMTELFPILFGTEENDDGGSS
ncbi:MAG: hypothetical protein AAF481_13165 [Acidobacteriota bacterium]